MNDFCQSMDITHNDVLSVSPLANGRDRLLKNNTVVNIILKICFYFFTYAKSKVCFNSNLSYPK